MLISSAWSLVSNTTAIESWEIERHEKLVHRARKQGGYVDGPDGIKLRIRKQEFPYDIGVYKNIRQSMGRWPVFWLLPFAPTPRNADGLGFDTNGFEGPSVSWPPPDPDRIPRRQIEHDTTKAFLYEDLSASNQFDINAFRQRQARFARGYRDEASNPLQQNWDQSWQNSEGKRLQDFGVDEYVDYFDEDNISLASLIKRS
ncbi:MAG: hypothetical protein LQ351_000631 [Letrouitia transgressa]|nr:MAG: hypothetical protein LQ351_000631 [Letrouitia transgressa]